jgi:DNA-directed RNA polymerase beta' subunit
MAVQDVIDSLNALDLDKLREEAMADVRSGKKTRRQAELGEEGAEDSASYLRSAVNAVYGYDDSPNPKIRNRRVSGFLTKILGSNPKVSWVQSKLLAKPQDFVGRGVITPNPDLGMDEVAIPKDMAWTLADPHLQKALVAQGIPTSRAMLMIRERHPTAQKVLEQVMRDIPVIYSRSPAWHAQNVISGYARIADGDNIEVSPLTTAGYSGDFDGDTMSVHFPAMPESIKDARERLLPSIQAFSVRNRDDVVQAPKHEQLLGLAGSQLSPSGTVHRVASREEALAGITSGKIKLQDQVEIGPDPMQGLGSQILGSVGAA